MTSSDYTYFIVQLAADHDHSRPPSPDTIPALSPRLPDSTITMFTVNPRPSSVTLTSAAYPLSIETGAVLAHT